MAPILFKAFSKGSYPFLRPGKLKSSESSDGLPFLEFRGSQRGDVCGPPTEASGCRQMQNLTVFQGDFLNLKAMFKVIF